jgi:hypothetical protein
MKKFGRASLDAACSCGDRAILRSEDTPCAVCGYILDNHMLTIDGEAVCWGCGEHSLVRRAVMFEMYPPA